MRGDNESKRPTRGAFSICKIDLQQSAADEFYRNEMANGSAEWSEAEMTAQLDNAPSDDIVYKTLCWGFDTEQEAISQLGRISDELHVPMEELAVIKTTFAQELRQQQR